MKRYSKSNLVVEIQGISERVLYAIRLDTSRPQSVLLRMHPHLRLSVARDTIASIVRIKFGEWKKVKPTALQNSEVKKNPTP